MRTIEQGVTVFTSTEIRVALLPIGKVPQETLHDYCELIEKYRHVDLTAVKSFYHEKQKSPLKYLPWNEGALHFRFVQERAALQATPLAALHAGRAVLGVIGVCHCPSSPDISAAYEEFEKMAKQYPSAVALRCFAFQPMGDEQQDTKKNEHLIMFPPGDEVHIEQHVEVLMHDFAACVLMELQQGMLEMSLTSMSLSTPIDEPSFSGHLGITDDTSKRLGSEDEVKQRRRHTRLEKLLGDWCLLAGSPKDSLEHYMTCVELAKLSGDVVWSAAALEGIAEAKVVEALVAAGSIPGSQDEDGNVPTPESPGSEVATPMSKILRFESSMGFGGESLWRVIKKTSGLEHQVRTLYMEAGHVYQRRGILPLQIEVELKRVRFTAGLHGKAAKAEVSDILTQVMDQWPLLKSEEDRVNVVVEAAQVLGLVGCFRKRAFLIWQALEAVRNLQSSDRLLLNTALKSLEPPGDHENQDKGEFRRMEWSLTNCGLPHSNWYLLHRAMLEALLPTASRAGSNVYVWEATATLLREHCTALSVDNQLMLMDALKKASEELDSVGRNRPGPGPPPLFQVRGVSTLKPELRPIPVILNPQTANGPFLFKPAARKRDDEEEQEKIQWVVGEECSLEVYIANPCAAQVKVDRLSLYADMDDDTIEGPVFQKVPVSVVLPGKTKPTRVSLGIIPQVPGVLRILGVRVTLFGVTWLQTFTPNLRRVPLPQGSSLAESSWGQSDMSMVASVEVLAALPLLKVILTSMDTEEVLSPTSSPPGSAAKESSTPKPQLITVYEGQNLGCKMKISNPSKIPVTAAIFECKKSEHTGRMPKASLSIVESALQDALPLAPGCSVEVPVSVCVESCITHPSTIVGQVVSLEVSLKYISAQNDAEKSSVLGREAKVPLKFKCLPAIGIKSVKLQDQYYPFGLSSDSGPCSTLQEPNNDLKNGEHDPPSSTANGEAQKSTLQNRQQSDNNSSEIAAVGCFPLSCDCVIELDVINHMERDANVHLQSEASAEALTHLQPGGTTTMSCVVPPVRSDWSEGGAEQSLEEAVTDWIHANIRVLWEVAQSSSVITSDPTNPQLNLEPSTGISGAITLAPDMIDKLLYPRLVGALTGRMVMVSIGLLTNSEKRYVDLRSCLPEPNSEAPDLNIPAHHWGMMSGDVLQDATSAGGSGQDQDTDGAPYDSAFDSGPRGPNEEVWGVDSTVGDVIDCELIVENGTQNDVHLCLSLCMEELDSNLSLRGIDADGPGVLILGKMGNVVLEVEKGKVERHRFSLCPITPGTYEVFACEERGISSGEDVSIHNIVHGVRLNLFCKPA